MKKLKTFLLVSLLVAGLKTFACGPYYWVPSDYNIYLLLPYDWNFPDKVDFPSLNCEQWCRETGLPLRDTAEVRRAIYQGSLSDWEWALGSSPKGKAHEWFRKNTFVKRLRKKGYNDAAQLLYLSKKYECLREQQRSPWYYNSHLDGNCQDSLRSIISAVTKEKHSRFADRWSFLLIKTYWALGMDKECVSSWNKQKNLFNKSLLHDQAGDYAARSQTRMERSDDAAALYAQIGRPQEAIDPRSNLAEALEKLMTINPESPYITLWLNQMFFSTENSPYDIDAPFLQGNRDYDKLLPLTLKFAQDPQTKCRGQWIYASACLLDKKERSMEALEMISKYKDNMGDDFLDRQVRVLTFYLRCKNDSIDDAFEKYALAELKWMDAQLQQEWSSLPQETKRSVSREPMLSWISHNCFMFDAMNRIVLADDDGLAWRFAATGRKVRAIQMANMADNRLVQLIGLGEINTNRHLRNIDEQLYYWWWDYSNYHDYSNHLFLLVDGMDAATIEEYISRLWHPIDSTDSWLNSRGYTDGDYWQDIVGTHFLRERNYTAAVAHLSAVSPYYQRCMNICFVNDPFAIDRTPVNSDSTNYKLNFAKRMAQLQLQMLCGDDDSRGLALLEYSIGLQNSFDMTWYLTSYARTEYPSEKWGQPYEYYPEWDFSFVCSPIDRLTITNSPYAASARNDVPSLKSRALSLLRSDDARARYFARLGQLATVMARYASTPTAQHYALVCDQWSNYRL